MNFQFLISMDEKKNCWMQGGDTLTKVVCGPSMFTFEDWLCRLKEFLIKAPLSKFKLQGRNRCPGSPYTCLSDKAMREPRSQDPYPGSWPSPGARWKDLETRLGYAHAYGDGHVTDVLNLLFNFFFFFTKGHVLTSKQRPVEQMLSVWWADSSRSPLRDNQHRFQQRHSHSCKQNQ